jgi:hypothetical protein
VGSSWQPCCAALQPPEARAVAAERIEAFTDRRVGRYWTLVGIINGCQPDQAPRRRQ